MWTYLAYGPWPDEASMRGGWTPLPASEDPLFLTVIDRPTGEAVGIVTMMSIDPAMRHLELGNIWYAPRAQRTRANTESVVPDVAGSVRRLGNRRVEWKCDALNARSRAAAERLGFTFEGIFRQHMIIKERNRDTAWYAMLDHEWPAIRANFERVAGRGPATVAARAERRAPAVTTLAASSASRSRSARGRCSRDLDFEVVDGARIGIVGPERRREVHPAADPGRPGAADHRRGGAPQGAGDRVPRPEPRRRRSHRGGDGHGRAPGRGRARRAAPRGGAGAGAARRDRRPLADGACARSAAGAARPVGRDRRTRARGAGAQPAALARHPRGGPRAADEPAAPAGSASSSRWPRA